MDPRYVNVQEELKKMDDYSLVKLAYEINKPTIPDDALLRKLYVIAYGQEEQVFILLFAIAVTALLCTELADRFSKKI